MKKPYRVEMFSDMMDMEANVATIEQASDLYFKGMDSGFYHSGHVLSNETGEVFCHFSVEKVGNGIEISQWVAVE